MPRWLRIKSPSTAACPVPFMVWKGSFRVRQLVRPGLHSISKLSARKSADCTSLTWGSG